MKRTISQVSLMAAIALTACLAAGFISLSAQQRPATQVAIGATDLGDWKSVV